MKKCIIIIMLLITAVAGYCRQPERGYRGFIEWDNALTTYDVWYPGNSETFYYWGVSTSHGYQFNPNFYLGAGLAVRYCNKEDGLELPLFLHARTDQKFGGFTPFAELRAGYTIENNNRLFAAPTIGYRFNWGRKAGLNVGVGLSVDTYKVDLIESGPGNNGYWEYTKVGSKRITKAYFTFRIGFDF